MTDSFDQPPAISYDGFLFSKGTYQVRFLDQTDRVEYWPFLHFDHQGRLLESFCTCDQEPCPHIALAIQFINQKNKPLHVLFEQSIFYKMAYAFFLIHHENPELFLGYKEETFCFADLFSIRLFSKAMKEHLRFLFDDRLEQSEETSLKFTHLDPHELELYKKGEPSLGFQFELSIFRDIAATWFIKSQLAQPKATFLFDSSGMPNQLEIDFQDESVTIALNKKNLEEWIPYFSDLPSNLFFKTADLDAIFYLPEKKQLKLSFQKIEPIDNTESTIEIGSYLYYPKKGFVAKEAQSKVIDQEKIPAFFQENKELCITHLSGFEKEDRMHSISYELGFEKKSFFIRPYVFEPKDLLEETTALFGEYLFMPKKGFIKIEPLFMGTLETIVPLEKMAEFLTQYREFFQDKPGFQLHQQQLESALGYRVFDNGSLEIQPKAYAADKTTIDLGSFVYVDGSGFFRKGTVSGLHKKVVPRKMVDDFIKRNQDELATIDRFFTNSPIEDLGLDLQVKGSKVHVNPVMTLSPLIEQSQMILYERYGYLKGEGFFVRTQFLPEKYKTKRIITQEKLPSFLRHELLFLTNSIRFLDPKLKKISPSAPEVTDIESIQEKGLWKIKAIFKMGKKNIDITKVVETYLEGQEIFFTPLGYCDLKDRSFFWLSFLQGSFIEKDRLCLTTFALLRLLSLNVFALSSRLTKQKKQLIDELFAFTTKTKPDLSGFKAQLRSYQTTGLEWLWFLHERGLSGLLCDDMGLGKTHQVLALAAALHNQGKKPFLVVCPTSVLYHWEDLFAEVLPHLKVSLYHGLNRQLASDFDVVITTYGILRRGDKLLNHHFFQLAIFDEMQIAKNPNSQTNKALRALHVQLRIGLSGTPIENKITDLKALFDVVLPSFLPQDDLFYDLFVHPIEKLNDPRQTALLQKLIKPFVMRRKKTDVLKDLPPKIEQKAYCSLEESQSKLYVDVSNHLYQSIEQDLLDEDKPTPFLSIFSLLTKLKMLCNHPALFLKEPDQYTKHSSGKWELFKDLLHEAIGSEQKVVVFTQYLGMIDIMKQYLTRCGIGFASIQGSTINRSEQLKKFKEDPNCKVFVGSLRAVGLGVNLSTASIVIHYDRWWNPAWENQATDRVHRIGQKRGVQVFKLITKNTIEEKIDQLIEKKMKLMGVVQTQKAGDVIKTFTKADWMELIETLKNLPSS